MKEALLVIDIVNSTCSVECETPEGGITFKKIRKMVPKLVNFISEYKKRGGFVIYIKITPWNKKHLAKNIVANAKALADAFINKGYKILTGGTDNHIVLIDILTSAKITGVIAEKALEECGIIINKNKIFGDKKSPLITSGIRLGTNITALRGMKANQMNECADLMHKIFSSLKIEGDTNYNLDTQIKKYCLSEVKELCNQFPIPNYP